MTENTIQELSASRNLIEALGFEGHISRLKSFIRHWIDSCDKEMVEFLKWQFLGRSKYFRPVTTFACHQAVSTKRIDHTLIQSAVVVELLHNVSLIIDDILDRSRFRRDRLTLHCKFGNLPALMSAGFITAEGFKLVKQDSYAVQCLADLLRRLGVAECLQWRLRRHPLGVEDWREIAGEDTGSMFETCACLGTRNNDLRAFGRLLGILYHGCDDVGDVRGAIALGGGGEEDLRDGILTLPVAIAIRNPEIAVRFRNGSPSDRMILMKKMAATLPEAEKYLDRIAQEAIEEAESFATSPEPLITLVLHTRLLSSA